MTPDAGPRVPASAAGPPSAAGDLEPYGLRAVLTPVGPALDPEAFLVAMLQDLAAAAVDFPGLLIGHLKCVLRTPHAALACNLTSIRTGAHCTNGNGAEEQTQPLMPGETAYLDLTVLVYGVPASSMDALTRATLRRLLEPLAVHWSVDDITPPTRV